MNVASAGGRLVARARGLAAQRGRARPPATGGAAGATGWRGYEAYDIAALFDKLVEDCESFAGVRLRRASGTVSAGGWTMPSNISAKKCAVQTQKPA